MREHPRDVIVDKFQEAVVHILEHHSGSELKLEATDSSDALQRLGYRRGSEAEVVSARVSLHGENLQSTLTVLATTRTTITLAREMVTCAVDWIGELANLLLGSMKNNMVAYGINPVLGLPSSIAGLDLHFITDVSDHVVVAAETHAGPVIVALNFDIGAAETWEFDPQLAPADEGVVCLF